MRRDSASSVAGGAKLSALHHRAQFLVTGVLPAVIVLALIALSGARTESVSHQPVASLSLASHRSDAQRTHSAHDLRRQVCNSKGVIAARDLRRPVAQGSNCDLVGRTVRFEAVSVRVPRDGVTTCRSAGTRHRDFQLCVGDQNSAVYAVRSVAYRPTACNIRGSIPAKLLLVPVMRSVCNLEGRDVTFGPAGAFVPELGTTCNYALGSGAEYTLCVTRDSRVVFTEVNVSKVQQP